MPKFIKEYLQIRNSKGEILYTSPAEPKYIKYKAPKEENLYLHTDPKQYPFLGISRFGQTYSVGVSQRNHKEWLFMVERNLENLPSVWAVIEDISFAEYKEYKDFFLRALNGETPDEIRKYFPQAVYVVTRSFTPSGNTPWKRVGRRSYLWVVPLEERDADKGRRIEWGGDTVLYATRKEALNALYNNK